MTTFLVTRLHVTMFEEGLLHAEREKKVVCGSRMIYSERVH
jgi:hypothetical protein